MSILLGFLSIIVYFIVGTVLLILLAVPEDEFLYKISLLCFWPLTMLVFMVISFLMTLMLIINRKHKVKNKS